MIFCNTRIATDRVQNFLARKGYASQALHGEIPQAKRMKTMEQFKQGEFHILVATDVAARGIHIEGLALVVNYDVPVEKDSYIHRIGRTGRAGHAGRAVSLVTGDDIMSLYAIEEHIKAMITEAELPADAELDKHRAEIDKWIEANSLKAVPSRAAPDSSGLGAQRRPSRQKPAPDGKKGKSPQYGTNTGYKKDYSSPRARQPDAAKAATARPSGDHGGKYAGSGYSAKTRTPKPEETGYTQTQTSGSPGANQGRSQAPKPAGPNYARPQAPRAAGANLARPQASGSPRPGTAAAPANAGTRRFANTEAARANSRESIVPGPDAEKKISFIQRVVKGIFGKRG